MSTTSKQLLISLGIVVVAFVGVAVIGRAAFKTGQEMGKTQTKPKTELNLPNTIKEQPIENWKFEVDTDSMTDKKTVMATTQSVNAINLDFPYSGAQHARLMVRKHPRYGKDIILSFSRGQIDMDLDGGNLLVRFDNEQPQKIYFSGPSDNSRDTAFLRGFDRLYSKIKKSKSMDIEIVFFSNGVRHLKFDVSNFPAKEFEENI